MKIRRHWLPLWGLEGKKNTHSVHSQPFSALRNPAHKLQESQLHNDRESHHEVWLRAYKKETASADTSVIKYVLIKYLLLIPVINWEERFKIDPLASPLIGPMQLP